MGREITIEDTRRDQEQLILMKEVREIKGTLDLMNEFIQTVMETQEVTTKALKKMHLEIELMKQ